MPNPAPVFEIELDPDHKISNRELIDACVRVLVAGWARRRERAGLGDGDTNTIATEDRTR